MADYGSIVSLFPPENQVATARVAAPSNPDQTAQIIPIAKELGVPPVLVESDPQFWTERARLKTAQQHISTTPLLSSWLAANPTNAQLSSDDIPTLAKVAPAIPEAAPHSTFFDSISRGWTTTEHHRAVADAALGIGEMPPPLPPAPPAEPGILPYLRDTFGSFIGSMGSTLAHAAPVAAGGAAIGTATGGPFGAVVGGGTGLLYGIAADMALTAGGAVYEQTGTYRDGDGNSLPENTRRFAALAAGTGTAALTMLLPGIGKPALEAGKALITDTVTKAIPYVAAEIGKAGVKGGFLNMAFAAIQSIPEELARLGTPGFDNLINDPAARQAFIDRHAQAFIDGVLLFGALGVPSALVHPIGAAITSRSDIRTLDNLVATSADSKLRGRSPDAFGDFVRSGNRDDIAISPRDPPLLKGLVSPEEIADATARGADVHLPLSEYVAKVDPATHQALRDDIRMAPEAMTLREAGETTRLEVAPEGATPTTEAPAVPQPPTPTALPKPGEAPLEVTRRTLFLEPLIKEPLPGMTQVEFERYSRLLEAQAARAGETAEPLAGARERAIEKVDRRRDVAAYNTIATTEGLKLDPVGDAANLPRELLRPGGFHLDDVAAMLGYRSGAELARDLSRVDREAAIEREMALSAASVGVINRALNSKQLDVLIAEARALGGPALDRTALRTTVTAHFEALPLKEATRRVLAVVARAGRTAEQALLKGDIAAALNAKLQQAAAFERARQHKALEVEVERFDRLASRYAAQSRLTNRDQAYTNQIHRLLAEFGRPISRSEAELMTSLDGKSLESFVREKNAEGRIISDPPTPTTGLRGERRSVEQLTVAEFRQLHDFLTQLDHNSREESLVGRAGAKVTLDTVVGEIRANLADRQERVDPFIRTGLRRRFRQIDAMFLRMERLIDWIDQKDPNGPLNRAVFRPIKEANVLEDELRKEATAALRAVNDRAVRRRMGDLVENPLTDVDGRPMRLTRGNVIAMALNMGTESNFDKLTRGYKWDPTQVRDLVNRTLTADEWKFVQGIWDVFERFWPRADEVVRRVSGVGMDKIEPITVTTPHGEFRGGYYPIEYDPNRSNIAEVRASDLFEQRAWFNTLPARGYTKQRTAVAKPLRLDLDFIGNRLSETIHDIAYREALTSANKVLSDQRVRDAVNRAYGPEYTGQFKPWLQHIAGRSIVDDQGLGFAEKLSRESRLNMNVLMLGFRPTTAMIHGISALSNSIREVGPIDFSTAVTTFFRTPAGMRRQWEWANEMSPELRNRSHNLDRDMNVILDQWSAQGPPVGLASVRQHFALYAMSLISTLDKLSAVPTWIAAYKQGLGKGMIEADAIAYGDKIVRNAHGSGGLPDLAPILRGNEYLKHFTMFMSYFNHNYNQVRDVGREFPAAYRDMKVGDMRAGTAHFVSGLGGMVAYLIVPALVHELIKEGLPSGQKGDGVIAWALKGLAGQVMSQVPILRDVAHFLVQGHGRGVDVASPLGGLFDAMTAPMVDMAHKVGVMQGPVSKDWVKHAIAAPGAFIGLSTDQLGRTGQFLWDTTRYGGYKQYANDPVAWYRGIVYGKSHPKPGHH